MSIDRGAFCTSVTFLIIKTTLANLVLVFIVAGPQIYDPHIRFDDFPALLGQPQNFYWPQEGRWINYLWLFRSPLWPAPVNYFLFYLGWALFSGTLSVAALSSSERRIDIYILSLLLVLCPQTASSSFWFNTMIPGIWIIALYALALNYVSQKQARLLMVVAVPSALMTYSTFPFLVLLAYFARYMSEISNKQLINDTVLFIVFFVLGINLIYALNYLEYGTYGVVLGEFRGSLSWKESEFIGFNFERVGPFIWRAIQPLGTFSLSAAANVLFAGSVFLIAMKLRIEAIALLVAMFLGIGLLSTHLVLNGYPAPFRSLHFVWVTFALVFAVALDRHANHGIATVMARTTGVTMLIFLGLFLYRVNYTPAQWQVETRKIATAIPKSIKNVFIIGNYSAIAGTAAAQVFHSEGLRDRLSYLTARPVFVCDGSHGSCSQSKYDASSAPLVTIPTIIEISDDAYVILPAVPTGP